MGAPKIEFKTLTEPELLLDILREAMLFEKADDEFILNAIKLMQEKFYKAGEPVFLEKESSKRVYFVIDGSVEVVKYNEKIKQMMRIKTFVKGENLSEFSVLNNTSHSTSCFALEDTLLLVLHERDFKKLLYSNPNLATNLVKKLAFLNQQVTRKSNYIEYFKPSMFEYNNEFKHWFQPRNIKKYSVIPISIDSDSICVALKNPDDKSFYNAIDDYYPKHKLQVFLISEKDFEIYAQYLQHLYNGRSVPQPLVDKNTDTNVTANSVLDLLKLSSLYSKMDTSILKQIAPYFKQVKVPKDHDIFTEGSASEKFYLIHKGSVELVKRIDNSRETIITQLGANDSFSEISLITGTKHSLTARASESTSLVFLEKKIFEKLIQQPVFAVSLASILANRLQTINRRSSIKKVNDINLSELEPSNLIPFSVVRNHKVIPIKHEGSKVTLGIVNPDDEEVYITINRYLKNYWIEFVDITEAAFSDAIRILDIGHKEKNSDYQSKHIKINKRDVKEFTYELVKSAINNRASDIHFEPEETEMIIRLRIDGELRELHERVTKEFSAQIVNYIKIQSDMDISEKRLPQDGQSEFVYSEKEAVFARVSSVPTNFGEKLVLRLIKKGGSVRPLNALAPDRKTISFLKEMTRFRQGLFVVTGPTGSGKSTTLYSVLNEMNSIKKNIVSVEDPVELNIKGITQIEVDEASGLEFGIILKNLLRQDPDIIMVGEIRDEESAKIAFEAALTGHLVLTTLHTNSTLNVVPRLKDLGVDSTTIASGLVGVLAQRLIPTICPHCKFTREITPTERAQLLNFNPPERIPETLVDSSGCEKCHDSGILDRIPVFEYWRKSKDVQNAIQCGSQNEKITQTILDNGFRSLEAYGMDMVINGLTKIEYVEEYLYGICDLPGQKVSK